MIKIKFYSFEKRNNFLELIRGENFLKWMKRRDRGYGIETTVLP